MVRLISIWKWRGLRQNGRRRKLTWFLSSTIFTLIPSRLESGLTGGRIEHIDDPETWIICARLLGIDAAQLTPEANILIPGMKQPLNQYQFFAAILFHRWGRDGKHGGYLADGMGLGKVRLCFDLLQFNICSLGETVDAGKLGYPFY